MLSTKKINSEMAKFKKSLVADKHGDYAKFKKSEGYALLIEAGNTPETILNLAAAKCVQAKYPEIMIKAA